MSAEITALITCKNERENIAACIRSVRPIVDEVLVADSGSTDGTLEVAQSLADRVIQREYITSGDFKNWAIPQCTHEWVLIIDADERMTPELASQIQAAVRSPADKLAYSIRRRNFFLGHPLRHGDWSHDRVTRLIRRTCRYEAYTDHAEINVPRHRLGRLDGPLAHYTAWNLDQYLVKMTHYAAQQAELWHREGKRPSVMHLCLNGPMRFVRTYVLRAGFLDRGAGFTVAAITAYYSFLKQAMLWHRTQQLTRQELDTVYTVDKSRDALMDAAPVGGLPRLISS